MSSIVHGVGLRNVGSYQVSGTPFVTGSTTMVQNTEYKITFPYVTENVTVQHSYGSGTVYVYFQSASAGNVIGGNHHVELQGNTLIIWAKCKEIYIKGVDSGDNEYQLFAQLTNIPTARMFNLTGSGITE